MDEYLLPKLEENAANGWPDWAVLWADRVWVIELKTEAGSHRVDQLPYYLRLAAAAHPGCSLDLTYITGPLPNLRRLFSKVSATATSPGTRSYRSSRKLGSRPTPEVAAYVEMVTTLVSNLSRLRPSEQREIVLGALPKSRAQRHRDLRSRAVVGPTAPESDPATSPSRRLLDLARATAADGRQRAVGAQNPEELEALRDQALAAIGGLPPDDATRFVLPWLWDGTRTGGQALTPEGKEFGYELRFSRYKKVQRKT